MPRTLAVDVDAPAMLAIWCGPDDRNTPMVDQDRARVSQAGSSPDSCTHSTPDNYIVVYVLSDEFIRNETCPARSRQHPQGAFLTSDNVHLSEVRIKPIGEVKPGSNECGDTPPSPACTGAAQHEGGYTVACWPDLVRRHGAQSLGMSSQHGIGVGEHWKVPAPVWILLHDISFSAPACSSVAVVVLSAVIAREMGGDRRVSMSVEC